MEDMLPKAKPAASSAAYVGAALLGLAAYSVVLGRCFCVRCPNTSCILNKLPEHVAELLEQGVLRQLS
ncbi:MAG: hypothetical protein DRN96_07925 [Thermoproteota archaeon]|nr:MAG: hypothetical protein DRN96_07925 [Candidatus Korarchaeota archaeon]RLG54878.1 MAG: hypothetical protein DRN99_04375 [Candidatus Korarchaeota archaeon]